MNDVEFCRISSTNATCQFIQHNKFHFLATQKYIPLYSMRIARILWLRNLCCLFLGRPIPFFHQSAAATLIAFPCWSIQLLYLKLPAKREGINRIFTLII